MRHLKKFMLLVMMGSLVIFTSCSKDDDGGSGGAAGSGTITAKIDGTQFTSLNQTSFAQLTSGGGQTTLALQGNTSSQVISITMNGYDGLGTYEISDDSVFIVASYVEPNTNDPLNSKIWSAPYQNSGVIGEIKISEETDTNIKGTFSFTGKNNDDGSTKAVTEGAFNLTKKTS
ncbi:DUF6252 family protein [Changchengzhania lutea]|uniref:DUF6252 family protein n=1 Tax=Changchengzhania lutea TaxID=2049305 RepID=UPI00115CF804|nr:DUF6252 family protein [Changchengzhania lutea]